MIIDSITLASIAGAFIHRFRGGWPNKPSFMPGHERIWAALIIQIMATLAFDALTGLVIALLYLFGSIFGWHNWMNCGDPNTYANGKNVGWIDDALFSLFGPYWVPVSTPVEQSGEFGRIGYAVQSPTGGVRPWSWRVKVACIGMAMRSLFYLPMLLAIPLMFRSLDALWLASFIFLFAPVYGLSRVIYTKTSRLINYRDGSLTIAESIIGALFGSVLMAQWILATS